MREQAGAIAASTIMLSTVATPGSYSFALSSDDGSKLYIDDK